jgi:hypothetical protein
MGRYRTVDIEVKVDLENFTDEELIEELESRGISPKEEVRIKELYDLWRHDRHKFEDAFRKFCWSTIGRSF